MAQILILEDNPERVKAFRQKFIGSTVVIVDTVTDCIEQLQEKQWDELWLDHDLGGKEMVESGVGTGYAVAQWLELNPHFKPPRIWVHSLNKSGVQNILAALPEAKAYPFGWSNTNSFKNI